MPIAPNPTPVGCVLVNPIAPRSLAHRIAERDVGRASSALTQRKRSFDPPSPLLHTSRWEAFIVSASPSNQGFHLRSSTAFEISLILGREAEQVVVQAAEVFAKEKKKPSQARAELPCAPSVSSSSLPTRKLSLTQRLRGVPEAAAIRLHLRSGKSNSAAGQSQSSNLALNTVAESSARAVRCQLALSVAR